MIEAGDGRRVEDMPQRRTTRRSTARQATKTERLDCDLDELAHRWALVTGTDIDFADAVRDYHRGKALTKAYGADARREEIRRRCAVSLANGSRTDGRYVITAMSRPDRVRSRLTSEAVRRASPALWEASRAQTVLLSISRPGEKPMVAPALVNGGVDVLIRTLRNEAALIREAKQLEADGRDRARAVMLDVAERSAWGGDRLVTTDGWAIGYGSNRVFNAALAATLAVEHGVDPAVIATDVLVRGGHWFTAREVGSAGEGSGDPYSE